MSPKSLFVCNNCGNEYAKWSGQCPACRTWNSLLETAVYTKKSKSKAAGFKSQPQRMTPISLTSLNFPLSGSGHLPTGLSEFDRALGGGLVPGQVVLLAGEPGIGKSTLLLQVAARFGNSSVLYVCGEESPQQIKIRAQRLGINNPMIELLPQTNVDAIVEILGNRQ